MATNLIIVLECTKKYYMHFTHIHCCMTKFQLYRQMDLNPIDSFYSPSGGGGGLKENE